MKTLVLSIFIAFSVTALAGNTVIPVCETILKGQIDISQPLGLPSLSAQGARLLSKKPDAPLPKLEGIHLTQKTVWRTYRHIGFLGKTLRGKYVLLQPIARADTAFADVQILIKKLAEAKLAVPAFGFTEIRGRSYLVRPLIYGPSPFSHWGAALVRTKFQQILDLEEIGDFLIGVSETTAQFDVPGTYIPGIAYVNLGPLPGGRQWQEEGVSLHSAAQSAPLSFQYALALEDFLTQVQFVIAPDGHLLVENLDTDSCRYEGKIPYQVLYGKDLGNWLFGRWSWFRYMLGSRLADDQVPLLQDWVKKRSQVEWLRNYSDLSFLISKSPDFLLDKAGLPQPMQIPEIDSLQPFPRPEAAPRFKNSSSFSRHFQKHGAEMGFATKEDYLAAAQSFIMAPPSDDRVYFIRQKTGDIFLTDVEISKIVVFTRAGTIRTFMKPEPDFHGFSQNRFYIYQQMMLDADLSEDD